MRNGTKLLAAAGCIGFASTFAPESRAVDLQDFTLIEKGRYLTIAADCAACHTVPDSGKPFAGGRPIETPFGNVVSANITPDFETGIGGWTGAEFRAALKTGIGKGGMHLYPAMPYCSRASRFRAGMRRTSPTTSNSASERGPWQTSPNI